MFSAEELSAETGVSVDRIHWMVAIGVIRPREPGRFTAADGFRAKMLDALLESGISRERVRVRAGPSPISSPASATVGP